MTKKLFLPLNCPLDVSVTWSNIAKRNNIEVTSILDDNSVMIPHNGDSAESLAMHSPNKFMAFFVLGIITDRINIGQYLPAIPAVSCSMPEEFMSRFGDIPVYLKLRTNKYKTSNGTSHLINKLWNSIMDLSPDAFSLMKFGSLVACPYIGEPIRNLEIDFALNSNSDILIMHCSNHGFIENNKPTNLTNDGTIPNDLLEKIQDFCKTHSIKNSIHNIQAVQYNGEWVIMDWNPRPSGMYPGFAEHHPGIADRGFLHMFDISCEYIPCAIELRSFHDITIDNSNAKAIRDVGLHPRWIYDKTKIARIAAVADSKQEIEELFNNLGTIINLS